MEKTLFLPDVHLRKSLPKPYLAVRNYIKKEKADRIILGGDFMDCSSLSHWNESKRRLIEGKRHMREIRFAESELKFLRNYCGELVWLEGNHENWIEQYVDKHPELEGMLEIPECIDLEKYNCSWIEFNKLYKLGHMYFTHGFYTNMGHAKKHLQVLGCNIAYGHTHVPQVASMTMKMQKQLMAWGLGCLCDREADYMKGRPHNWGDQFGLHYMVPNGTFNFTPVNIIKGKFILDGKQWSA